MTQEEYLKEHHHITESMIGLMTIQEDMVGVKKVYDTWAPKLKDIRKQRTLAVCDGMSEEEINNILNIMGLDK